MSQPLELNGNELEKWFKSIAHKAGILDTQEFKLEEVVRLFKQEIPERFKLARMNIDLDYPYGNQWIDRILEGRSLQISEKVKAEFADKLLDLSLATDAVVKGKNTAGKEIRIAVDVTWNKSKKTEKVQKIRGNSKPRKDEIELNKNIPSVRKKLGLDKHIVLLLRNLTDQLPSPEKLLSEINDFAEAKSLTKIINLQNLTPQEHFDWETYACDPKKLWDECSPGIKERTAIEASIKVATTALRKGHSLETVDQMMVHDSEYKRLLKNNQGDLTKPEGYAKFISQKASELINRDLASPKSQHDLNLRGLKAVRTIISTAAEEVDGKKTLATNEYRLTQQGTVFSVDDIVGQRGIILEFSQGVLEGAIAGTDIRKLESLSQSIQQGAGSQMQNDDRAEYVAIAQQVRDELGNISAQRIDIEVMLRAGENGDRLVAQSDHSLSLGNPDQVRHYIETIQTKASQYQDDKTLYKKFASGIQKVQGSLIPYRLDLEIYFLAKTRAKVQNPERLLIHSETTKAFSKEDPSKAQRYVKAIGELQTLYESLREAPNQEAANRDIPKLVHKKFIDPAEIQRQREEALRRHQKGSGRGVDGPVL